MKYYFAPLEGITNMYYRKAHNQYFHGVDKYFIPFLNPAQCQLSNKDKRELKKDNNNLNVKVVPQIISKNAQETLWLINLLHKEGYDEVNLNLGCPSKVVISKNKGSGMLKDLVYLDQYLNEVIYNSPIEISLKIRLGLNEVNEFKKILDVINKYKIKELIIHPRTAKEKYTGPLHLDVLDNLDKYTNINIIYNGEIKTKEDILYIQNRFPYLKGIMLGRGLVAHPDLLDDNSLNEKEKVDRIKNFFSTLYLEYLDNFGWNNTMFFIKEIWASMSTYFDIPKNIKKSFFKAKNKNDMEEILHIIYTTCPINENLINGIYNLD
ncbi:MAG: tRNA-dihydrouridine synthase family protein [Bacillales bacterium]|nr:tRNA-dihydrouridine synthase family protein [Bacillales bacterium]